MKKSNFKFSKLQITIIAAALALLIIYFGFCIYFINNFCFRSSINGINVFGKTVSTVNSEMTSNVKNYTLTLKERNDKEEKISASEIDLSYFDNNEINELLKKENPFAWVIYLFKPNIHTIGKSVDFNEELLKKRFDNLSCFDSDKIIKPVNAEIKLVDSTFEIIPEVPGTEVKKDELYDQIIQSINKFETTLDLDEQSLYTKPKINKTSTELLDAQKLLNAYSNINITYVFGQNTETLSGSRILQWLSLDDNYNPVININSARAFVNELGYKYNTIGKQRTFVTSNNNTVSVYGGNYGWLINPTAETQALIDNIKNLESISKEPIYYSKGLYRDNDSIGDSYVEIDLTNQHVWVYENGQMVFDTDMVSGNVGANVGTPQGTYRITYKEKNATLKGENYETPVSYWMPFNGNIGMHDAIWRSEFGGDIYLTNGSHGCINLPPDSAASIFNHIKAGTPVVCYF